LETKRATLRVYCSDAELDNAANFFNVMTKDLYPINER